MRNVNHNQVIGSCLLGAVLLGAVLTGCLTTRADPLENTKKLVREGHVSLYQNGAFRVPNTPISLIPAGPSTREFVGELMGMRASQSFSTSIEHAAQSVYIVSDGTKLTYSLAKDISTASARSADAIQRYSHESKTLLVYRSSELGKNIIGRSWEFSKNTLKSGEKIDSSISRNSQSLGNTIGDTGMEQGTAIAQGAQTVAKDISSRSASRSASTLAFAKESFIKGYVTVPAKLKQRVGDMSESLTDAKLADIAKEENDKRLNRSKIAVNIISNTVKNYPSNVSDTFGKAGKELSGSYTTTGLSFAVLKSLRWVLQGILWDATIEPAVSLTTGFVGYISVNYLAFPTMVVVREGAATTKLAVEATWNTARMGYDLVAPTGTAAVASVFSLLDFTGSNIAAGGTAIAGSAAGYTEAGLSQAAEVIVKGGGYAAGKSVRYIGVPLTSAGIALGSGTIGTAVGAAGMTSGGVVYVAGEAGHAATHVMGNVIAGTSLAVGTAASTAGGAAYGVYELSKAVVVPAGYELGGGIVLSYGTLSHLAAHSILAVSDCSYMVLSLEGPRWVLYAVQGKLGGGEDLPTGAIVDLKKMQESGEVIYYLPVRDEEMKKVVNSVYEELPEMKTEIKPAEKGL
jgi:hypothetical protein